VEQRKDFLARFSDGESHVDSADRLEQCLTNVESRHESEFWLIPSSPARQLGSVALRVFGIKPRPAVVVHLGPEGALVTFRDRNGGDYRVVNREYDGQVSRGFFRLHDGGRVTCRADELLTTEAAFGFVRDFFREGDRPWRLSCRPVAV